MTNLFLQADGNILLWIQENLRTSILSDIMVFITHLGDNGAIWITIAILLILSAKTRKVGIMTIVALIFSFVINNLLLKNAICRLRPFEVINSLTPLIQAPTDFSFPSGHSAASFAAAGILLTRTNKYIGIPAWILAILIAFSRLYVGVHYPTDVITGILMGLFIAMETINITDILCNRDTRRKTVWQ